VEPVAEQAVERLRKPVDGTRAGAWDLPPEVDAAGDAAKRHETLAGCPGPRGLGRESNAKEL
jgi:hypothetical protein